MNTRPKDVESRYFDRGLDWDHDGLLNRQEIASWYIPPVSLWGEFARDESRHLIEEADAGRKVLWVVGGHEELELCSPHSIFSTLSDHLLLHMSEHLAPIIIVSSMSS